MRCAALSALTLLAACAAPSPPLPPEPVVPLDGASPVAAAVVAAADSPLGAGCGAFLFRQSGLLRGRAPPVGVDVVLADGVGAVQAAVWFDLAGRERGTLVARGAYVSEDFRYTVSPTLGGCGGLAVRAEGPDGTGRVGVTVDVALAADVGRIHRVQTSLALPRDGADRSALAFKADGQAFVAVVRVGPPAAFPEAGR